MNIHLLKFNNYYNRKVKYTEDYPAEAFVESVQNVNFNPNDDIDTKLILNTTDSMHANYLLAEMFGIIVSRWFIIEKVRLRNGQYEYTLKRDVLADNYDKVIESPVFIEKATLDASDPLIFNPEGMTFNKIKHSETPLIDETKVGWIVGYTQPSSLTQDSISYEGGAYISVASLETWDFYKFVQGQGYWRSKARVYMGAAYAAGTPATTG